MYFENIWKVSRKHERNNKKTLTIIYVEFLPFNLVFLDKRVGKWIRNVVGTMVHIMYYVIYTVLGIC